jgi:hypothetical protein
MTEGQVKPKSYAFALEIVQVVQALQARKEYVRKPANRCTGYDYCATAATSRQG